MLTRITQLEREVETELGQARDEWRYKIEAGRVRFEHDLRMTVVGGLPAIDMPGLVTDFR